MKNIRSMFRVYAYENHVYDDDTYILKDYVLDERLDRDTLNDKIMLDIGERYSYWSHAELLKRNIDNWFYAHQENIKRLVDSTEYEYDAVHLKTDYYEDFAENIDKLRTDNLSESTDSHTDSEGTTIDTGEISAYDAQSYQPQNKSTDTSTAETDIDITTRNTGTVKNEEDKTNQLHHHGNDMNKDYADNIKKERQLALFNVYDWITDNLAEQICLAVF